MPSKITLRNGAIALSFIALLAAGCDDNNTADQKEKRANYQASADKVPFPKEAIQQPLERINVAEKLKRDSNPNRISYVYLLSLDGKVIAHFVVKGKVSSSGSQLLPTQEIRDCGTDCDLAIDAAGDDSTYGPTEPGIFFFTTGGQLITWSGDYVQSDRQLDIKTPISLVADAN